MFCDLVDWTGWAHRLDPEDLTRLTVAYYSLCCRRVAKFGGYTARFEGDGILAYFGYPTAREDAAECAIRAGLEIVDAMSRERLDGRYQCDVRVGMATGPAVISDVVGDGFAESSLVMGPTPSLAKRIQALTQPGAVTVSDDTLRLAGGLFDFVDEGIHVAKGFDAPVQLWRVLGESATSVRFDARRAARYECVGRESHLLALQAVWDRVRDGSCQAVTIVGEAGIGKSRLLRASDASLAPPPSNVLQWQCSSSQAGTPLRPVIAWLMQETRASRIDATENRRRLEAWLGDGASSLAVSLLAEFLSVPLGDGGEVLQQPPDRRRDLTREIVAAHLEQRAAAGPVLMMVEDAHWMDGATIEFLNLLLRRLRGRPVMVLITTRPEQAIIWGERASACEIRLEPLSSRDAERLIRHVCEGRHLPRAVVDLILARADGVPLYIEELTAAVLESGLLREERDGWVLDEPLPQLGIPSTLQDSLLARLDYLGDAKEIARVGSAIGREFSFALLARVMGELPERLRAGLDRLVKAQLLFRRGDPPADEYVFKHALVQQAAYDSQLRTDRKGLHARIVSAIEAHEPDLARHEPNLMAQHCRLAGMPDREVDYLVEAGFASTRMVAIPQALSAFARAEAVLAQMEETPRNVGRHIDTILGMMEVGRFAILPSRLMELAEKVRDLSRRPGVNCGAATMAAILFQNGRSRLYASRYADARRIFQEIRDLGIAQGSIAIQRKPASAFCMALCCQGLFDEMLEYLNEDNVGYYKDVGNLIDYISGLGWIAYAKCQSGAGDDGVRYGDLSVREAEQLQSPMYVSGALVWRSHALMTVRRLDEAVADARRSFDLGAATGVPYLRWHALVFLSLCLCRRGDLEAASESLAQARELLEREAEGNWSLLDYVAAIDAEISCFRGDHGRALELADKAIAVSSPIGGHFAEAMAWRVKAVSTVGSGGDATTAQGYFDRARALHQQGGARAEAAFSSLVWARALSRAGQAEPAGAWVRDARVLAERHRFVLERCEYGAAEMLSAAPGQEQRQTIKPGG
jgi:class 3 adenylate cyclase/tetratricopeptide (TPR) repeat protein